MDHVYKFFMMLKSH